MPGKTVADARRRLTALVGSPAAVYLVASVLTRAGWIVLIPLYTRRLSPEEYGNLAVAQTIIAILPTFLSWGMLSAVARAYFEEETREASIARVGAVARCMILVTVLSTAVCGIAILSFVPDSGVWNERVCSMLLVAAMATAISGIPAVFFRSMQRPYAAAAFQITPLLLEVGAGIVIVGAYRQGFEGALAATCLALGVQSVVSLVIVLWRIGGRLRMETLHRTILFSLPFVPHFLGNQIQQASDRWVMEADGAEEALGHYGLAGQLAAPAFMAVIAWNDAESAKMGEVWRAEGMNGIASKARRMRLTYMFAALIPSILIVCALPLVFWLIGPQFRSALWIVPFFCAATVVESLYYPAANIVFYAGHTAMIPRVTVTCGILTVVLNILLIPSFGIRGALVARGIAAFSRAGAMHIASVRSLRATT